MRGRESRLLTIPDVMDPAAATAHHRPDSSHHWLEAHGAVTQVTDHIVGAFPVSTSAAAHSHGAAKDR
ncbi:hypothetical protein N7532_003195 [Penicillium argentinense]|uniref:Uncharacterized protein n=1 Tax=Penicillium argentinense TaxID=1131581 RepID=A0A9W9FLZ8_9EURO|nr:uncharacterized protein N7532_003195 [Penicillium argentinense]KAJ5102666.1 hypothetical protein N7532_003195 [Penicillium argentinense]